MKKFLSLIFISIFLFSFVEKTSAQESPKAIYKDSLKHNSWELIITRPYNTEQMNDIRCYLKAVDAETGEDVTFTKIKANYSWLSDPHKCYNYNHSYFLNGGMSMHLLLKPGKYFFTFSTPKDKVFGIEVSNKSDWQSNSFYYDTENPAKVIWVIPTANENGFYNGGWHISGKAPQYYKFTKPQVTEN